MVINGLHTLGVLRGFQDFFTHFLDEVLFQDMMHIDDLPLVGNAQVALGILFSCVTHRHFYLIWTIPFSFSFLFLLVSFDFKKCKYVGTLWVQGPKSLFKVP